MNLELFASALFLSLCGVYIFSAQLAIAMSFTHFRNRLKLDDYRSFYEKHEPEEDEEEEEDDYEEDTPKK